MPETTIRLTSEITVRPIQHMGGDHSIVGAMMTSSTGEEALRFVEAPENVKGIGGRIDFLMEHRHGSPFEAAAMTFYVRSPIFVWREWHRHRIGFSYNEESGRYKALDPEFWVPRRDRPMVPVEGWKPGRPKFRTLDEACRDEIDANRLASMTDDERDTAVREMADWKYEREITRKRRAYETCYAVYRESIDDGIALEVARSVLGVGIYSSCWVTCNPRSLMHFLSLRVHDPEARFPSYPQLEIEEAARMTERFLAQGWPHTYRSFLKHGRVAP